MEMRVKQPTGMQCKSSFRDMCGQAKEKKTTLRQKVDLWKEKLAKIEYQDNNSPQTYGAVDDEFFEGLCAP
ncbi:hypothetical protein CR513_45431, partial [Mucuna pruriens]